MKHSEATVQVRNDSCLHGADTEEAQSLLQLAQHRALPLASDAQGVEVKIEDVSLYEVIGRSESTHSHF